VRADHQAGAAVAEEADRLLLAAGLAMEVDHDRIGRFAQRTGIELARQHCKGIVERRHEDAAEAIDDERALAVLGFDQRGTAPRRALRHIGGSDQPRGALDEHQRLALVPGMIAERDGVGAGIEQLLIDRLGDAEAARRVLAIDDDEIERPVPDQSRQAVRDRDAAAAADDVSDKQDSQLTTPEIEHPLFG
jgi:hypothetical protein